MPHFPPELSYLTHRTGWGMASVTFETSVLVGPVILDVDPTIGPGLVTLKVSRASLPGLVTLGRGTTETVGL